MCAIYPAYLFIVISYLFIDNTLELKDCLALLPMDLLLLQSSVSGTFFSLHHGGTWFISCLAFCYIITPSAINYLKHLNESSCAKLLYFLAFVDMYMFPIVQHMDYAGQIGVYDSIIYRGIEYVIGMIIAAMYLSNNMYIKIKTSKYRKIFLLVLFLIMFFVIGHGSFLRSSYMTLPVFIILLMQVLSMQDEKFLLKLSNNTCIRLSNSIAYEIFLAQFFCFSIVKTFIVKFNLNNQLNILLMSICVCIFIAILMNRIITIPGKIMLQRFLNNV